MDVDSNHNDSLMPGACEPRAVQGGLNHRGISRIRLIRVLGFVGLALLMAAPSLVGMVRPKPVDAVGWMADFTEAQAVTRKTGKPMILKFTADWCGPCRMLSREVFSDPQVGEFIRGAFVPVIVDVTDRHGAGQSIANQFQVDAIPTLVVVNADGQEQSRKIGYMDKSALRGWLQAYGPASLVETPSAGVMPSRAGLTVE